MSRAAERPVRTARDDLFAVVCPQKGDSDTSRKETSLPAADPAAGERHNIYPQAAEIARGLSGILADSHVLLGKTHGFHRNVTGPQFGSLHELFEQHYRELFEAIDQIAERIRALGYFAPGSLGRFREPARLEEQDGVPDAAAMLRELAADHEKLAAACREPGELCEKSGDLTTRGMLNGRIGVHEKAAWMLRASLPDGAR